MKRSKISGAFEVKAIGVDGTFSGYGAVFGNVDSYGDVIAPGAFAKSLAASAVKGRMPALLWQHDSDHPIGVWDVLQEDAKGLYVEGRLLVNDVPKAKEAHALLKAGALSGMSIGFMPVVSEWDDKQELRTLKEVDLWEVSLVTFPANDDARVSDVKSIDEIKDERDLEQFLREAGGFSRSCAKAVIAKARSAAQREAGGQKAVAEIAEILRINISTIRP